MKTLNCRTSFLIIAVISGLFRSNVCISQATGTVKDIDGNTYKYVTIGKQIWMVDNLKVTKYRNGDPIPVVTNGTEWGKLSKGAYCNYENKAENASVYGRLYNWYAITDKRGIAPKGWRVPTSEDWDILVAYLGGEDKAGGKLKEKELTHWMKPNTGATNAAGFNALPAGMRGFTGKFTTLKYSGVFWSSTTSDEYQAYSRMLYYISPTIVKNQSGKQSGFSVRCIKE